MLLGTTNIVAVVALQNSLGKPFHFGSKSPDANSLQLTD